MHGYAVRIGVHGTGNVDAQATALGVWLELVCDATAGSECRDSEHGNQSPLPRIKKPRRIRETSSFLLALNDPTLLALSVRYCAQRLS
jgi:hypothetical protein